MHVGEESGDGFRGDTSGTDLSNRSCFSGACVRHVRGNSQPFKMPWADFSNAGEVEHFYR